MTTPEMETSLLDSLEMSSESANSEKKKSTKTASAPRAASDRQTTTLVKSLSKAYATAALLTMPFNQTVGMVIAHSAQECAESWDLLAQQNPAVRRLLTQASELSGVLKVFAGHAPILVAVLGTMGPETLQQRLQPLLVGILEQLTNPE